MPLGLRTAVASATAALWRVLLTPVDTLKTTMQAHYTVHCIVHYIVHYVVHYMVHYIDTRKTIKQAQRRPKPP